MNHLDDLSITQEQGGMLVVKELEKSLIAGPPFPVLLFRYQTWDEDSQKYGKEEYMLVRYQKKHEQFAPIAKFRLSNKEQAQKVAATLTSWACL